MGIRKNFNRFYWKVQKIIAPSLKYSQAIYEEVLGAHLNGVSRWLDLGCGHHLLSPWRLEQERSLVKRARLLVGLDYDHYSLKKHKTIGLRIRGDISHLPFSDEVFELVTSNMVLEHLQNPEKQLQEIFRILKPGGLFIFHTQNLLGYTTLFSRILPMSLKEKLIMFLENRKEEDVFPTYYKINTIRDINNIADISGFQVNKIMFIVSDAESIMLPPIMILELLLIRVLMTRFGRPFRPNIIAVLKKAN